MNQKTFKQGEYFINKYRKLKKWQKIVSAMACVVVFCTTYALILPAITMEQNAYCGYEEHKEHSKQNGCYIEEKQLVCKLEETDGHAHSDDCYNKDNELICERAEEKEHYHTDQCYEVTEVLDCNKDIHIHSKQCFSNPNADTQTAADWEKEINQLQLTGKWDEDVIAIAKSQVGYKESKDNFFIDENGDKQGYTKYGAWYGNTYGNWCAMFSSFCLNYAGVDRELMPIESGCEKWVEELAKMKIYHAADHYEPKPGDLVFFDMTNDKNDDVNHVGIITKVEKNSKDEIKKIETIEGNSSDQVKENNYQIDDKKIVGYAKLPDNPNYKPEKEAVNDKEDTVTNDAVEENSTEEDTSETVLEEEVKEESEDKEISQSFEGDDFVVSVSYSKEAKIPDEAVLKVKEIAEDSDTFEECMDESEKLMSDSSEDRYVPITFARFFDISFESEGKKVEPEASVDVKITYKDAVKVEKSSQVAAIHFADDGTEVLEVEMDKDNTFSFTQDSFSITGTVITEDTLPYGELVIFMQGTDGKYYAIDGNGNAVEVQYTDGKVYCDANTKDIIWNFYQENNNLYFKNTVNSRYLTMNRDNVSTTSSKSAIKCDWDYGRESWHLYYNYTSRSLFGGTTVTPYYMYLNNSKKFVPSTSSQTVYFATDIIFQDGNTELLDPDEQPVVDAVYDHNKYIDYLGDGKTNNLTTLTGEDLYRLSLDMTGVRKPVDMLLVVDASGSMKGGQTGDQYTAGMPEVIKFLNGTGNGTYGYNPNVSSFEDTSCNGFINEFFELNNQNRLAIAAFGGYDPNKVKTEVGYVDLSSNPSYDYHVDAWKIKGWNSIGQTYSSVPVATGYYPDCNATTKPDRPGATGTPGLYIQESTWVQGTNYSAGLMMAEDMFHELDELGNGGTERVRILVFLSDGQPTYSIIPTSDSNYPYHNNIHYVRRGQGQNRYYLANDKSSATGTPKTNDCFWDSEQSFERYRQKYPEVVNYSIAFKVKNGDEEVLKYIGSTDENRSNHENFKNAEAYTDIMDMILGVFRPLDVSITDRLTEYVDFFDEQPDVKVTMTPKSGGAPIVLWEGYNNGSGTTDNQYTYKTYTYNNGQNTLTTSNRSIVKYVTYDQGQITVKFDEHYTLDQAYTYALSFNVKATDQAYDTYAFSGYNNSGDTGTDYNENTTSSEQNGLRSNAVAVVQYKNSEKETEYKSAGYKHPVIQVDKCDLILKKVDQYENALSGAVFTLKQDGNSVGTYTVSDNGTVTIPSKDLVTGDYELVETIAPEGAEISDETISFAVERGMIDYIPTEADSNWTWGEKPRKVTQTVGDKIAYPKNQHYHYNMTIKNVMPVVEKEILLQKTDSFGAPLNHAKFTLYQDVTDIDTKPTGYENKAFTIAGNNVNRDVVEIDKNLESGKKTVTIQDKETEIDALIYSGSLEIGTYYLVEESAPEGYNKLKEPVVIEISPDNVIYKYEGRQIVQPVKNGDQDVENSVQITNTNGYKLPQSGGSGTYMFTMGGMLLISISLLYGFYMRRKKQERRNI